MTFMDISKLYQPKAELPKDFWYLIDQQSIGAIYLSELVELAMLYPYKSLKELYQIGLYEDRFPTKSEEPTYNTIYQAIRFALRDFPAFASGELKIKEIVFELAHRGIKNTCIIECPHCHRKWIFDDSCIKAGEKYEVLCRYCHIPLARTKT